MAPRKRIGLVFSYNENWIAGAYYILNIIHALNTLTDKEKPMIIVFTESNENFLKVKNETNYPYLELVTFPFKVNFSFAERVINKLGKVVLKKQIISKELTIPKLDFVYPKQLNKLQSNLPKVNWIPDFQEDYLPQYFSKDEVDRRKLYQKNVVANGDVVVLSSEDSKADFIRLYPNAKAKPFVLPFAVTHPDFESENISKLLAKFSLPKHYFFAPNQFWAHKNHMVIFKAIKILKSEGIHVSIALSGKENDPRNKVNFSQLKDYISEHNLEAYFTFLGFLPRKEQLCLFKNSIAIIQPSLFEGWSTVVEDAKALGKYLIVSDLNVHKEQIKNKDRASFFKPKDDIELARILKEISLENPKQIQVDYKRNIESFSAKIMDLINFALTT